MYMQSISQKREISSEQMKKLWESGKLGLREHSNSFTSVSFLANEDRKINSSWLLQFGPHKNLSRSWVFWLSRTEVNLVLYQGGLRDSEYKSDTKILSVPDSETDQESSPYIPLKNANKAVTAREY